VHFVDHSALETHFIMQHDGVLIGCETETGLQLVSDIHVVTTRPLTFSEGRAMAVEVVDAVREGVKLKDATIRHMLQQIQRKWNSRSKRPTVKLVVRREPLLADREMPS
jgi:hypothetical protein